MLWYSRGYSVYRVLQIRCINIDISETIVDGGKVDHFTPKEFDKKIQKLFINYILIYPTKSEKVIFLLLLLIIVCLWCQMI